MKKTIPLCLLFLVPFAAQAQNWLWARSTTGGIYADEGLCVTSDHSGNVFVGGEFVSSTISFGSINLSHAGNCGSGCIVKYDPNGNELWGKSTGCGDVWAIATDASGNVYFTGDYLGSATLGSCALSNSGDGDFFIAKYDPNGNCLWSHTATGVTGDRGYDVFVSPAGDVYACGLYTSVSLTFGTTTINNTSQGWDNIFLVKYDANGNLKWVRNAGGTNYDDGYNLAVDGTNNIYITGYFAGSASTFGSFTIASNGGNDIFLAKYDSSGTAQWCHNYGGTDNDAAYSVCCTPSGNVLMTGFFTSPTITFGTQTLTDSAWSDGFITMIDPAGNVIWAKSVGGSGYEYGYSVDVSSSGKIAFSGGSDSPHITYGSTGIFMPSGSDPSFIFKLDSLGNMICSSTLPSAGDDQNAVSFDPSGNIFFGGDFYNTNPFILGNDSLALDGIEDIFVSKFNANCQFVEGMSEADPAYDVVIYPNPSSGKFGFTSIQNISGGEIRIMNSFGQMITDKEISGNNFSIDLSDERAGIYFYVIQRNGTLCGTGKLLRQ